MNWNIPHKVTHEERIQSQRKGVSTSGSSPLSATRTPIDVGGSIPSFPGGPQRKGVATLRTEYLQVFLDRGSESIQGGRGLFDCLDRAVFNGMCNVVTVLHPVPLLRAVILDFFIFCMEIGIRQRWEIVGLY